MLKFVGLCVVLGAAVAVGCSSSTCGGPADGGGGIDADGAAADGAADGAIMPPDSPAGRAVTWFLGALNGTEPTQAEVTAKFTPLFLQQVPATDVIEVLAQLAQARPWTLTGFGESPSLTTLVAVLTRVDGQFWRLSVNVDAQGRIAAALIQPAPDLDPALDSWDEIDAAVAALAPQANLMAATVDEAGCTPLHAVAADASLAVGSSFKLWVLAALAADVAAGRHVWNETIPIEDAHKSLPSGTLQDQAAGTLLPLRTFANQMISISDNTAADHLLFLVGRTAVESMLATTGHHAPVENQPFLATREVFNLELMVTDAERQAFISAGPDERRRLLDSYDAAYDPRTYAGPPWIAPKAIDKLEWFATPGDLCGVMRALRDAGAQAATAPVLDILAINPGLGDATHAFSYVGYKGGSEPGVLNMTWLLRRAADQPWLFFSVGWNDTSQPLDEDRATYVAGAGRAMLGRP